MPWTAPAPAGLAPCTWVRATATSPPRSLRAANGAAPRSAVPDRGAAVGGRPLPRPGGQARALGLRPCAERLARATPRGHRAPARPVRPGLPRPRAGPCRATGPADVEARNANYVGGDIGCGSFGGLQVAGPAGAAPGSLRHPERVGSTCARPPPRRVPAYTACAAITRRGLSCPTLVRVNPKTEIRQHARRSLQAQPVSGGRPGPDRATGGVQQRPGRSAGHILMAPPMADRMKYRWVDDEQRPVSAGWR